MILKAAMRGHYSPRQSQFAERTKGANFPFAHASEQASHGGELTAAVEAGAVARGDVTDLGAVLIGDARGRRRPDEITLFDSTGPPLQDLAIAKAAFSKVGELDLIALDL
jgi:ornithine cyclodeaminase/alanine dehydrogenase-like protein (mu-crystallin family)